MPTSAARIERWLNAPAGEIADMNNHLKKMNKLSIVDASFEAVI